MSLSVSPALRPVYIASGGSLTWTGPTAGVTAENARTVNFWQKQGFEMCGTLREVGHKFGRWLDVSYFQMFV